MNTAHRLADGLRSVISYWTPTPTTSQFLEKGTLTPQEFVDAGDQLTFKFPTWKWERAKGRRQVSWLPPEKQYLSSYGISCRYRVRHLEERLRDSTIIPWEGLASESWFLPPNDDSVNHSQVAPPELTALSSANSGLCGRQGKLDMSSSDVVCFDEIDDILDDNDAASLGQKNTITSTTAPRTYDLSVTYDKYYQCPRLWLKGYNEQGLPLDSTEIFEDILTDYVARTVTIDPHPCTGQLTVSIHPCRHAAVMLKVVNGWRANGVKPRHDLALVVLLKLISSVIPSIEYDTTTDIYGFRTI